MRRGVVRFVAGIVAVVFMSVSRSDAGFAAVEFDPSQGALSSSSNFVDLGYQFQVSTQLTATALGYYDFNADGLSESHLVRLYTDDGSLLASATVLENDSLSGNYRYRSIAPVPLSPGTYRVVGLTSSREAFKSGVRVYTTASGISALREVVGSGSGFPTTVGSADTIFAAGSLMVESPPAAVATPLPPTLLAGLLGMTMLAGVRRLRRA